MHGMKWFRVYSEIKDDPKILELDDHQRWLWICLLAMASESPERGTITGVRLRGLAAALRTDESRLAQCLEALGDLEMIEHDEASRQIWICHWEDRQYDRPSDTPSATRDRKRKSRVSHADVTTSHALVTPSHATEENRIEESREEGSAAVFVKEGGAKAKRERAAKPPPPAEIETIRRVTGRYPDKVLWESIVAAISGKSEDDIRAAYTAWIGRGFNRTNYAWALEWVPNGIPSAPGKAGKASPPNGLPAPEVVWGVVQAEIDRVHYSGTPSLPAPILAAVEAVGGWYTVCKCDPAGSIPARLRDAYRHALGG